MSKLYKTISVGLLLPILILNLPIGSPKKCISSEAIAQRTCCTDMLSNLVSSVENVASMPCVCHLSEDSRTKAPVTNPALIITLNSKKFDKHFENISPQLSTELKLPTFSFTQFNIFSQPKFLLNLKIYTLISTYRI